MEEDEERLSLGMLAILVAGWMAVMLLKAGAGGAVLQGIGSADLGLPDFDYLSSNDPDFYNIFCGGFLLRNFHLPHVIF